LAVPATSFRDPAVKAFENEVAAWLEEVGPPYRQWDRTDAAVDLFVRRAWEAEVHRAGYSCLSWPIEYGGKGLGPIEEFVFAAACAQSRVPEGLGRVGRLLAGPALFAHGTDRQRSRFLPAIVSGEAIWCQGFSEPDAGSDLASLRTTARREGDHYVIRGQKLWISFGGYADWCLLLARTGDQESRHRGLTMFVVPMRASGTTIRSVRQITGRSDFAEIFFDGAEVDERNRIGAEGEGWACAMTILGAERGAGFAALAIHQLGEDLASLAHCTAGKNEFNLLERDLRARLGALRLQVMRTVELDSRRTSSLASASILKLTWSELMQDVARTGLSADCPEHMEDWRALVLDRREVTIASGTSEIQRNIIAERVLGLPR
jgi:alkylation response protein AidB-like acyl-CoA dehydrogenase